LRLHRSKALFCDRKLRWNLYNWLFIVVLDLKCRHHLGRGAAFLHHCDAVLRSTGSTIAVARWMLQLCFGRHWLHLQSKVD